MPRYRKKPTAKEETILRTAAEEISNYLDFAVKSGGKQKHRFIRRLYGLYRKIDLEVFIKAVNRALKYRMNWFYTRP
jgi:hypothetical protein